MKCLALAFLLLVVQDDPIPRLVDQLGADEAEVREKASAEIWKLGARALPHLDKAAEHRDPEVRARAADLRARGIAVQDVDRAIAAALGWLARHQSVGGSWFARGFTRWCESNPGCAWNDGERNEGVADFEEGVSGLALLAFVRAGYTPRSRSGYHGIPFGGVIRNAFRRILERQDEEGCLVSRKGQKYMYAHAICTLALTEFYARTQSWVFKDAIQKAVDFTVAAQNPRQGWRYSYKCGDNDTSVTAWTTLALCAARKAGYEVPKGSFDGAHAWFDEVTEEACGRAGYTYRGTRVSVGGRDNFDPHETLTAMAAYAKRLLGTPPERAHQKEVMSLLLGDKPRWSGTSNDFYYWFAGSLALSQLDGPEGEAWTDWSHVTKQTLVKNQRPFTDGCRGGSWDPVDRWGSDGGRVYATALNALTLEICQPYSGAPRE